MRLFLLSNTAFAIAALAACTSPSDGVTKAKTEAAQPDTPAASSDGAEVVAIGTPASTIKFVGKNVTSTHHGEFKAWTGKITLDPKDVTKAAINLTIDMASVWADNPKLTGHLKMDDFFGVAKFPQATFTSTAIKTGGEGAATHTITGNLNLRGISKSVTFPATVAITGKEVTATAKFVIDRKQWGVQYEGAADNLVENNVVLDLNIKAPRKGTGA